MERLHYNQQLGASSLSLWSKEGIPILETLRDVKTDASESISGDPNVHYVTRAELESDPVTAAALKVLELKEEPTQFSYSLEQENTDLWGKLSSFYTEVQNKEEWEYFQNQIEINGLQLTEHGFNPDFADYQTAGDDYQNYQATSEDYQAYLSAMKAIAPNEEQDKFGQIGSDYKVQTNFYLAYDSGEYWQESSNDDNSNLFHLLEDGHFGY